MVITFQYHHNSFIDRLQYVLFHVCSASMAVHHARSRDALLYLSLNAINTLFLNKLLMMFDSNAVFISKHASNEHPIKDQ